LKAKCDAVQGLERTVGKNGLWKRTSLLSKANYCHFIYDLLEKPLALLQIPANFNRRISFPSSTMTSGTGLLTMPTFCHFVREAVA
jgi:hypothetical protein